MAESDSSPGERTRASAEDIHAVVRSEGEEELSRPVAQLAWSGLAAGLSMSLSLMAEGLIRSALPDAEWRTLIESWGYTVGFIVVILGRQQLFTENTLTAVMPVLDDYRNERLWALLRLWLVVFVTNIAGTVAFAGMAAHTELFEASVRDAFREIGSEAVAPGFLTVLLKGIPAGWMIALTVWLLPGAGSARIVVIAVVTYFISLGGFAHVIAGSAEAAYASFAGVASWTGYFTGFLLPALLGNIIGGVVLVATLNHLQVRSAGKE